MIKRLMNKNIVKGLELVILGIVLFIGLFYYAEFMLAWNKKTFYPVSMMVCRKVNCDVLEDPISGKWVEYFIPGDHEDIKQIMKSDEETRERLGLPKTLIHPEAKCGPKVKISGTNLQHECDPKGKYPCCNEGTSWCGITDMHCKHPSSVDYRLLKDRHKVEWVEDSSICLLANIGQEEACTIMKIMSMRLVFIGDSQAKEFFTSFLLWISRNFEYGAIHPKYMEEAKRRNCDNEFQITDPKCKMLTFNSSTDVREKLCDGNLEVEYFNTFDMDKRLLEKINKLIGKTGTYVILGNALRYELDANGYIKNVLEPLVTTLANSKWPKVIVETLPAIPSRELGNKRHEFSQAVNGFCKGKSLLTLDNFPLGMMLRSYDGRHYGLKFNVLKIKLLVNFLTNICSQL